MSRFRRLFWEAFKWFEHATRVVLELFHVLQVLDFTILVITYCITKVLADLINWVQWIAYGDFPGVWMPVGQPRGIVFLAPAYTSTHRQLVALAHKLHQEGYIVCCLVTPKEGNVLGYAKTIERNRERLGEIKALYDRFRVPIVFFGISYGGCVAIQLARAMKKFHRQAPHHIIAVQAPIRGTRLAKYGKWEGAQELLIGSPAICKLRRSILLLEGDGIIIKYLCAFFDEMVRRSYARPAEDGDGHHRWADTLPHIGHWGALQNPFVLDVIVGYIRFVTRQTAVPRTAALVPEEVSSE